MKKVYYILSVVVLISICCLYSCSKYTKKANNDLTKTNIVIDEKLATLFNEYSELLDGKDSEKYASNLYDAYKLTTPESFVNTLSEQEINHVKYIIELLVSEVINTSNDTTINEFTSVFLNLLDNKNLSKMEQYIVYDIYANILYYQITL